MNFSAIPQSFILDAGRSMPPARQLIAGNQDTQNRPPVPDRQKHSQQPLFGNITRRQLPWALAGLGTALAAALRSSQQLPLPSSPSESEFCSDDQRLVNDARARLRYYEIQRLRLNRSRVFQVMQLDPVTTTAQLTTQPDRVRNTLDVDALVPDASTRTHKVPSEVTRNIRAALQQIELWPTQAQAINQLAAEGRFKLVPYGQSAPNTLHTVLVDNWLNEMPVNKADGAGIYLVRLVPIKPKGQLNPADQTCTFPYPGPSEPWLIDFTKGDSFKALEAGIKRLATELFPTVESSLMDSCGADLQKINAVRARLRQVEIDRLHLIDPKTAYETVQLGPLVTRDALRDRPLAVRNTLEVDQLVQDKFAPDHPKVIANIRAALQQIPLTEDESKKINRFFSTFFLGNKFLISVNQVHPATTTAIQNDKWLHGSSTTNFGVVMNAIVVPGRPINSRFQSCDIQVRPGEPVYYVDYTQGDAYKRLELAIRRMLEYKTIFPPS